MIQRIEFTEPPLIDKIAAAFPNRGRGVFYSWGDVIFNPDRANISAALRDHESVHGERQVAFEGGASAWWMRYIADPAFRLAEEIPAHRAEWLWHCAQPGSDRAFAGWRSGRQYHLHFIASRLAGPLYGGLISLAQARRAISDGGARSS